eukprot:scaffold30420_cov160-Skeletonema_dohrnii-CCMP3373.AAC.7
MCSRDSRLGAHERLQKKVQVQVQIFLIRIYRVKATNSGVDADRLFSIVLGTPLLNVPTYLRQIAVKCETRILKLEEGPSASEK